MGMKLLGRRRGAVATVQALTEEHDGHRSFTVVGSDALPVGPSESGSAGCGCRRRPGKGNVSVLPAVAPRLSERTLQRKLAAVSAFYGFHRRLDPAPTHHGWRKDG